jgi:nitroreductase
MSIYQHPTEVSDGALDQAATAALGAPSIFNTQPWRWRIHGGVAELRAERERQLRVVDPQGRLLMMSCGVALHHLRAALAASGTKVDVARLPESDDPDLLARVRVTGAEEPAPAAIRHYKALLARHTDRRPFQRTAVPAVTLDAVRAVVEANGAHLHVVRPDQVMALIVAADRAAAVEVTDAAYRAELASWTHRPPGSGDGVPDATVVPPVPRRVALREFLLDGPSKLAPGDGDDRGATYTILFTAGDDPFTWLRAGEALGAALVTAVEHGAAVSPMSDLVEVAQTRETLRRMLAGIGHPMVVLRIGLIDAVTGVPETPRRSPESAIEHDAEPGWGDRA